MSSSTGLSFSGDRKRLLAGFQKAAKAVTGRSTLPILSHILIRGEDGYIEVTGNDMEMSITTRVEADIHNPGVIAIPAGKAVEIFSALPDGAAVDVDLESEAKVQIKSKKAKFSLLSLSSDDYPAINIEDADVKLGVTESVFYKLLKTATHATSTDETRVILTGVLINLTDGELLATATDTHRLALTKHPIESELKFSAILPMKFVSEALRLLSSDSMHDVQVEVTKSSITLYLPGDDKTVISSRLIEGQFPNYQRVIPSSCSGYFDVNRTAFEEAVKRLNLIARDNASRIIIELTDGLLKQANLSAESATSGSVVEDVDVEHDTPGFRTAANGKYLMDAIQSIDAENIRIEFNEPLKPLVMRSLNNDGSTNQNQLEILMPMQIV